MMKTLTILLAVFVVATTSAPHFDPSSDEQIFYINNVANATWKAGHNFNPGEYERIKKTLTLDLEANKAHSRRLPKLTSKRATSYTLPRNLDLRKKMPQCLGLRQIWNQGECDSSWAVGSVTAMSDRICIAGGSDISLSAQQLISCYSDYGCSGGQVNEAYSHWRDEGIVTGGPYGSDEGCYPYEIPTGGAFRAPPCKKVCRSRYEKSYNYDKHYADEIYQIDTVTKMMEELASKGSITASLKVHPDLKHYKSGIYHHIPNADEGHVVSHGIHAVRIIGYGDEYGVRYWLVANSWGTGWGDNGFFKIRRGTDECGIESIYVAGGIPKIFE